MLFTGEVTINAGEIKTLQQLVQTAIAARTFPTAQQETDEISRWDGAIARDGTMAPVDGPVSVMKAYAGVLNGKVSSHDGVTLVAADFANASPLVVGDIRDLERVHLGSLLIYAVGTVKIAIDSLETM